MKKLEKPILADGEHTGHAHRLQTKVAEVWERSDGVRIFDLPVATPLQHEEHKTITLPARKYNSDIVREFDPFEDVIRRVQD